MKYYVIPASLSLLWSKMTLLWKHIRNGLKPTMDRQQKKHCVCVRERARKNSSTRTSKRNYIHALNFALGSWPLNEIQNDERCRPVIVIVYMYVCVCVICLCILYIKQHLSLRAELPLRPRWKEIHAALATTTVHCGSGSHSALSRCWPMLSYCSRALSLLRTVTALVPAALLFSKRHWGFGIEPTLCMPSRSYSCSPASLLRSFSLVLLVLSLSCCAFVCVYVRLCVMRLSMRFPLLVCLIAFGNYYYAVAVVLAAVVVAVAMACCCCCCRERAKKVSQMSCLGPRCCVDRLDPRGVHTDWRCFDLTLHFLGVHTLLVTVHSS